MCLLLTVPWVGMQCVILAFPDHTHSLMERSGSVVECLNRDLRAAGSSLTGVTSLCPWASHINPSLALIKPRKTRPYIAERLLMGRKESNQTNKIPIMCVKVTIKLNQNLHL